MAVDIIKSDIKKLIDYYKCYEKEMINQTVSLKRENASLRKENQKLKSDAEKIADIKRENTDLKDEIRSLKQKNASLNGEIRKLQSEVHDINKKVVSFKKSMKQENDKQRSTVETKIFESHNKNKYTEYVHQIEEHVETFKRTINSNIKEVEKISCGEQRERQHQIVSQLKTEYQKLRADKSIELKSKLENYEIEYKVNKKNFTSRLSSLRKAYKTIKNKYMGIKRSINKCLKYVKRYTTNKKELTDNKSFLKFICEENKQFQHISEIIKESNFYSLKIIIEKNNRGTKRSYQSSEEEESSSASDFSSGESDRSEDTASEDSESSDDSKDPDYDPNSDTIEDSI